METTNTVSTLPNKPIGLLNVIRWWLKPRSVGNDEEQFLEKTMRGIVLLISVVLTIIIIATFLFQAAGSITMANATYVTYISICSLMVVTAGLIHRGKIEASAVIFVTTLMAVTLWMTRITAYWVVSPMIVFVIGLSLGILILPRRYFRVLVAMGIAVVFVMPLVTPDQQFEIIQQHKEIASRGVYNTWVFRVLFSSFVVMISGLFRYYINEFDRRRDALNDLIHTLEDRVAQRTRDLEVAAQVSTQITTVLDHHELLPQIVNLTKDSFNLYQVSVFVYDTAENVLKYEAGTGEAGRIMKARGKQFTLDEQGLVPRSASLQKPQRVGDVRANPNYYQEETLPNTRSELAVPMIIGDKLIGVLDLQSAETFAFTDDDLVVMQQLAKQIAIALQNARLYAYQLEVTEELRAVDEMKSQFLASMSHELRTPLNAILNFSKFINMGIYGEVTEKQVDAMGKIIGSAQHLLSLINDVLDITKIESGMMQLFVEDDIDLHKEIDPVVTTAQTLLGEKAEVQFAQDIDTDLPPIIGDKRRIRQILLNLVSNACKFTETGTVTFSAKHKGDNILFAVIDTGPGINSDKLDIIFEPFQQTETGVKHAGGTGLGLPISKKLAEAHDGRLWVETTEGEGSAFFVEIPVRSAELVKQLAQDTVVEA